MFSRLFGRIFLLLTVVVVTFPAWAAPGTSAAAVATSFFGAMQRRDYQQAYQFFSDSIRQRLSYDDFVVGAQRILAFRMVRQEIVDKEDNLVKFSLRANLRIRYQAKVYQAVYAGLAAVYRQRGQWRILSVDLKALSQQELLSPDSLQY